MILYRCDECGKEVEFPITIRIVDYVGDTLETKHACGPDDAIRLSAPIMRNGHTLGVILTAQTLT